MANEQSIENLKKLKSFHNGSYGADIDKAIKALEQESCDDAISRQALLDAFGFSEKTRKWGGDHSGYNTMMLYEIQDIIESQPSVKPQEKTGHWIMNRQFERRTCDNCNKEYRWSFNPHNYCPNCGARMVEEQEISYVVEQDLNEYTSNIEIIEKKY